jgi:hypothetical protein
MLLAIFLLAFGYIPLLFLSDDEKTHLRATLQRHPNWVA